MRNDASYSLQISALHTHTLTYMYARIPLLYDCTHMDRLILECTYVVVHTARHRRARNVMRISAVNDIQRIYSHNSVKWNILTFQYAGVVELLCCVSISIEWCERLIPTSIRSYMYNRFLCTIFGFSLNISGLLGAYVLVNFGNIEGYASCACRQGMYLLLLLMLCL